MADIVKQNNLGLWGKVKRFFNFWDKEMNENLAILDSFAPNPRVIGHVANITDLATVIANDGDVYIVDAIPEFRVLCDNRWIQVPMQPFKFFYDESVSFFRYWDGTTYQNFITSGGEANDGANVGAGVGIYRDKTGFDINLRSIIAGTNIDVVQNADDIVINNTLVIPPSGSKYVRSGISTGTITSTSFVNLPGSPSVFVAVAATQGVLIQLVPDHTYNASALSAINIQDTGVNSNPHARFRLIRNGSINASRIIRISADDLADSGGGTGSLNIPPSIVTFFDEPGLGAHTYSIQAAQFGSQMVIGSVRILATVFDQQ